ncbi:MAG: SWIM zinc finger family protein [Planctomycetaceae bacterium]|nr:SWIM zinc finger family protein [Planctomycetaceae bacterium]
MATVAPEVRGAQPAPPPPVRTGKARLVLVIDGVEYRLSKSPAARAAWHLKRLAEPRKGQVYCVLTHKNVVTCSCPDTIINGAVCKHVLALRAVGLVSRRAKPEAVLAAQNPATAPAPKGGDR